MGGGGADKDEDLRRIMSMEGRHMRGEWKGKGREGRLEKQKHN